MSVEPAQMFAITLNTKKDVTNIVKRMHADYQEGVCLREIGEECSCLYLDVRVGSAEMLAEFQRAVDVESFRGISYSSCYAPFPENLRIYYDLHDMPLVYYSKNVQSSAEALLDDEKASKRILAKEKKEREQTKRKDASIAQPAQMLAITLGTMEDVKNILKRMRIGYEEVLRLQQSGQECYCLYVDVRIQSAKMLAELQRVVDFDESLRKVIRYSLCYAPFPCTLRIYYDCHDYPLVYYSKNVQSSAEALLDDEKACKRILAQEQKEREQIQHEIESMKKVKRVKK